MRLLKHLLKNIILLIYFFLANIYISNSQQIFIENKGQLPKQVFSNIKIPNGELFLEKGKLKYCFFGVPKFCDHL